MNTNIFDRLSFWSLFAVIVLLPVFFLPFTNIPVETSKGLLLVVGLVVSFISWAIARFLDGRIIIPRSWLLVSGFGIVFVFLLSALLSSSKQVSMFGTMFDVGSFWFIFSGILLMFMSSIILKDSKKAKIVLFGAILSSAVVLVFQIARLFAPQLLSLGGIFAAKTDNLVGTWNTLGIFAGFASLMSLLVVEFFSTTKVEKIILQILTILSLVVVAAVNFPFVWELLGVLALIIFVYKVSITSKEKVKDAGEDSGDAVSNSVHSGRRAHFPVFSFIVIMITLLFFMSLSVREFLPNRLQLESNEVSPSFSTTLDITKSVLKESPIFGIGPNKFSAAWAQYKPVSINSTPFWDVSFNSGSGMIPTLAATTGILGILSLIAFFVLFLISGVKSVFSSIKHGVNWETVAFFVLSLYLFISSFFYSTGSVIFLLSLAFTGAFVGLSVAGREKGEITMSFLSDHRKSFFSILFIIVSIIVSAAVSFKYFEKFASVSYFGKALSAPTVPESEGAITRALRLHVNDLYLRTYSQVYLVKLNDLVKKGDSISEAEKKDLQSSLDQAVNGATLATTYNSKNYLNFQTLGSVYQSLGTFGVKDVYSKAVGAYQAASVLNPNNPGIKLAVAGALFADGQVEEAKDYANQALTLKADYIDALITLSQIARSEGKNSEAISYAERALLLSPTDESIKSYVDSLKGSGSSSTSSTPNTSN